MQWRRSGRRGGGRGKGQRASGQDLKIYNPSTIMVGKLIGTKRISQWKSAEHQAFVSEI